jgi:hypothetical protein
MVCGQKARTGRIPGRLSGEGSAEASMTTANEVAQWMLSKIEKDGCIYQDDVVDYLVKTENEGLLRENSDGNLVVGSHVLEAFRSLTEKTVVWVKPDRYWRFRVPEDEPGREARG